jgi:hypothetical protein
MDTDDRIPELSLLGGPLHRLGCRAGLVRAGTNTVRLGLALAGLAWGVLILLSLLQGTTRRIFSLAFIAGHVRLLVAIPLFFLGETWVAPRMTEFVGNILDSGLVPEAEKPVLAADVRHLDRIKDSWLAEAFFLLVAFAWPLTETVVNLPGTTASWTHVFGQTQGGRAWVAGWYMLFCLPLYRFLVLRWLWHLGLWWYFLRLTARLKLNLVPTHSDGAAGLGYLEVVHEHFIPLVLAMSAVLSASFAEDIVAGIVTFATLYLLIPVVLLLNAVLFVAPLLVFSGKLWRCRNSGLDEYMAMAGRYAHAFDHKWLRDKRASGESQLGTPDVSSLADLTTSVRVIREMRLVPVSWRLLTVLAIWALVPLLPLFLLEYPVAQIAERLLRGLASL